MSFNKKIFLALICIQLIIIGILFKFILDKKNVLGTQYINAIPKKNIQHIPAEKLNHFYEPLANTEDTFKPLWLDYTPRLTITTDRLNESKEYSIEKPTRTFRIVTLGDSFTYGLYVDTNKNWTSVLEDKLNTEVKCNNYDSFEVINLGIAGYDLRYSIERYNQRGQKYKPDLVLLFIKDDDFIEQKDLLSGRQEELIQELKNKGDFNEQLLDEVYNSTYRVAMQELYTVKSQQEIVNYHLSEFSRFVEDNKSLAVITYPSLNNNFKKNIQDILKQRNVPYYFGYITNTYNEDLSFLPYDAHPNAEGHKVIAEDVLQFFISNILKACTYNE